MKLASYAPNTIAGRVSTVSAFYRPTIVALAPPTMQAVDPAIDGRERGPLLVNRAGRRMTAYNVQYLVAALTRDAGIEVHLTPHGLRHSAITIGRDAGYRYATCRTSPPHADSKTTRRYDRSRHALNRHATYTIAYCLAGWRHLTGALPTRCRAGHRFARSSRAGAPRCGAAGGGWSAMPAGWPLDPTRDRAAMVVAARTLLAIGSSRCR
jgi:hypothetical protein